MSGPRRESAPASVVVCFLLTAACAVGFAVAYGFDLSTPVFGATFGGAFAFLALGLAIWSAKIDKGEPDYVEERALGPTPEPQYEAFKAALTTQPVPRSRVLFGMLAVALTSIGAAALFPLRSMFPKQGGSPDQILEHTPWVRGAAVVNEEGKRIKPDDMGFHSTVSVFPQGVDPRLNPDAAAVLVRVPPASLQLPPARMRWVVDGVVAYSRLCTHAGCPVGLYSDEFRQLLCPCHHSIFDVLRGAVPVEGPAARPLPQLPLGLGNDGYLIALGDFTAPPGAGWWGYPI